MKKVLVIAGKLYIGGAERVCRNIGFFADPTQFQIDYLVFGEKTEAYEPELMERGCRIWHFPSPSESYPRFYGKLKELMVKNRYDVVHCHTMFNSGLVLRAAKQCGVPIRIAHSHSIQGSEGRSMLQRLYEKTMRRWIRKDATHYVGCGQASGEWLFGEKLFHEKGIVLLNGVDLDRFAWAPQERERIRRELGWEDCFVIGHAGHMVPVKNQAFLLELMPELLENCPNARLILLGDGVDRSSLEQIVKAEHLEKAVIMPGNVTNVNEYLSAMDVFAFPSRYEGMPLAIVEAQANGVPCVLSDRVPKDVCLTDLITVLPLDNTTQWTETLLSAKREHSERYAPFLRSGGFDTVSAMEKIYALYAGEEQCQ